MIFGNYLLGFIEDNAGLFVVPRLIKGLFGCTEFIGYPTGLCQNLLVNNQPFILTPAFLLAKLVNPILVYNIIVLSGLALNFLFALRFFKQLFGRFLALILSAIFLASPYFAYQSRSHFDLIQFWPVIWFLHTFFLSRSRHKNIYLGLLLTLVTGVSNYLGFFTLIFATLYLMFCLLMSPQKILMVKNSYKSVIKTLIVFILSSSIFLIPYIKSNFFLPKTTLGNTANSKVLARPIEDFVIFSSRPWYCLLPSVDNPFFGGASQSFLDKLASGGNYLTQNYFKSEHAASYLGWVNLALGMVGALSLLAIRRNNKNNIPVNYSILIITILGMIILTMPPLVIINGVVVHTPSYLLFKFFPMFRVLARAGILILFLTLIFTGYGYRELVNLALNRKIKLRIAQTLLLIPALFSISEFFIPIKITHVGAAPKVYSYLSRTVPLKSPAVIYPYNHTNEAIFWILTYQKPLINPRFYEDKKTGFVSSDFTSLLNTPLGLEKAHNMGARYLVYFYEGDKKASADFFNNNAYLSKVGEFSEQMSDEKDISIGKFIVARIIELGNAKSNSAILYLFK